ncbi:hypothetical protein Tco_0658897 [Tanacetum coccineum]
MKILPVSSSNNTAIVCNNDLPLFVCYHYLYGNPDIGTDVGYRKASLAYLDVSALDKPHFQLENLSRRLIHESNPDDVQYLYCKTVITEPEVYAMAYLPHFSSVIFITTCSYSSFKDSNIKDESSGQTKIHFRNSDNLELPQNIKYKIEVDQVKITTSKNDKNRRLIALKTSMNVGCQVMMKDLKISLLKVKRR